MRRQPLIVSDGFNIVDIEFKDLKKAAAQQQRSEFVQVLTGQVEHLLLAVVENHAAAQIRVGEDFHPETVHFTELIQTWSPIQSSTDQNRSSANLGNGFRTERSSLPVPLLEN